MPRSLIFLIPPERANCRRKPRPGMIATSGGLPLVILLWSTVA